VSSRPIWTAWQEPFSKEQKQINEINDPVYTIYNNVSKIK
jgi:hypothetical protein